MGIAIFNGIGAIGGFAGPYVVGSLVDKGGYEKCMYVLGALFAVLGALILGARSPLPPLLVHKGLKEFTARSSRLWVP